MKTLLLTCCITLGLGIAFTVLGAEEPLKYQPVVKLPYLDANENSTQEYVNALYMLAIMVAALLAVVKIIFGGVKWMFSDVITDKSAAKKDIQGALLGLLIVLIAVIVLRTINPNLVELKFLEDAPAIGKLATDPVPPPDAEIGDITDSDASDEELKHFRDTCPGVINSVVDSSGNTVLACDETADAVSQMILNCSGNTCTCNFASNGNHGFCVQKCQTAPPTGTEYIGYTDSGTNAITCNYHTINTDVSSCGDIIKSCQNNMIPMICEPPATSLICRTNNDGLSTHYYGFKD
jgi:hypothetical protein